jgi:hypothetical protein
VYNDSPCLTLSGKSIQRDRERFMQEAPHEDSSSCSLKKTLVLQSLDQTI